MNLFRSNSLERRRTGGLEQIRSRYMKRPIVLTPEQERRRARVARITPRPRYMNVMPKPGDWCLYTASSEAPLVCFDTYQEAFEFPVADIPLNQGVDHSGRQRYIHCQSRHPSDVSDIRSSRDDGFYVGQVLKCRSDVSPWPLKRDRLF